MRIPSAGDLIHFYLIILIPIFFVASFFFKFVFFKITSLTKRNFIASGILPLIIFTYILLTSLPNIIFDGFTDGLGTVIIAGSILGVTLFIIFLILESFDFSKRSFFGIGIYFILIILYILFSPKTPVSRNIDCVTTTRQCFGIEGLGYCFGIAYNPRVTKSTGFCADSLM